MEIVIVYEDQNLIVINKPSGLIVHPANPNDKSDSVVSWLMEKYPEISDVGESASWRTLRPGIVHRLDKETSGLMLIAKNNDAFFYLKNLFQEHKIKKHYLALVYGRPKEPRGIIDAPLGKIGAKQTIQIIGTRILKERNAITEYKTLQNFKEFTLLEVMPKTGRTHQIRVHLKSIGTPIAGDKLYSPKKKISHSEPPRLFLHAYKLELLTPDQKSLILEADLPEDLQKFVSELE
ncbi:MAG: hypothetical protein A2736_01045 [Candidatus Yanofskybacteria bacterium RIFCSPHIGHO2_01_FULL_41_27]|uniref:Pseudouridine synthase n=3 Tax=Parcubacteria group TaxID=1794811 RepID=A0A1F8HUK5_9BACT|nr:MAG: Pseudouridine synthase [Candidatus Jorgensenbacteria bacterium GW2011_GWF2_41_8]OGM99599.1 MAG: hypothetical protein A2736_01045 [Candidatus Yanofskybacteria bacterium RIFCSPHIGHO2_01_FULL_41_27]OGN20077.1 MAG: hypothetical protein A3B00_00635 [Candidatus Yanofskybacteria bacterium RIFCSPLOWO2_01_FULL_41_33]OGN41263.1 MAG: hypothetical protein A2606_03030 [Candidatus Yanofskybacteria bacterium RIFOXYD1_FULL_42_10]